MTEELNEKYIYKLSDNKYRIKFLKIEPGTKKRLYFNLNSANLSSLNLRALLKLPFMTFEK